MLKQLLRSLNKIMTKRGVLVPADKMATYFDLLVLDATVVHLHLELDKARTNNDPNLKSYIESTANDTNFVVQTITKTVIRQNNGNN